jgi:hypothetical protein
MSIDSFWESHPYINSCSPHLFLSFVFLLETDSVTYHNIDETCLPNVHQWSEWSSIPIISLVACHCSMAISGT